MKKILILTATAGSAHNACAETVRGRLNAAGALVEVVDMFQCYSPRTARLIDRGYSFAVERLRPLYNLFYEHYCKTDPANRYSNATRRTCLSAVEGLMAKLLEFQPDAVFCTHYGCAVSLCYLKLAFPLPCKIFSVCLDYTLSPFWESAVGVDGFFIPHQSMLEDCMEKGYRREQLLPVGMPIRPAPAPTETSKKEIPFTVLVLFGGGNWNGVYRLFRMTLRALQGKRARIVVVNGKNKKSFKKTARCKHADWIIVENMGYTQELPRYFSEADVVINKCGGANAAEMLNAAVPMLIYEKIPAQERHNLAFLRSHGAALSFKNAATLQCALNTLLDRPSERMKLSQNASRLAKNGLEDIAATLLNSPTADWKQCGSSKLRPGQTKKSCKRALKIAAKQEKLYRKYPFLKEEYLEWYL